MRIIKTAIAMLLAANTLQLTAQTTTPAPPPGPTPITDNSTQAGHFLFGTNFFSYNTGSSVSRYTSGNQNDTSTQKFSALNFSINIYAGYMVTNNFCAGISFDMPSSNVSYAYLYGSPTFYTTSYVPVSLFLRYYFINNSTGGLYIEGILGADYSLVSSASGNSTTGQSSPLNVFSFNSNLNFVFAGNINQHFAVPIKSGITYNYTDAKQNSDDSNTNIFNFTASLGLEYKF